MEKALDDMTEQRQTHAVLSASIDALSWERALNTIATWARRRESRYVCICNVHSCVTAGQDKAFGKAIAEADMATPDGAPVAWVLRKSGFPDQQRINGPDLMWKFCSAPDVADIPIFLYGGAEATLGTLRQKLENAFPSLTIAGAYSPPFRTLNEAEELEIVNMINASGAAVVWVSLGCPKQELWMARHRGRINAVMIGVGAAFDYHAGTIVRAPHWMQRAGLEWFHRLCSEPRRLWRRYLVTNSVFIVKVALQLCTRRA